MREPFGRSLHIGVNAVDPGHYAGYAASLKGCENDAWAMARVARAQGFTDVRILLGRQATADAVLDEIRDAAADLPEGSFFLLTFAGHGAAFPNADRGPDDREKFDQAWCLYDRALLDDELRVKCWPFFRTDTRVLVIIDACHSATSIDGLKLFNRGLRLGDRVLPPAFQAATLRDNEALYDALQRGMADKQRTPLPGTVMSFSACADKERTPDDDPHGKFTQKLMTIWNNGQFSGTHAEFFVAVEKAVFEDYGRRPAFCCDSTVTPAFRDALFLHI